MEEVYWMQHVFHPSHIVLTFHFSRESKKIEKNSAWYLCFGTNSLLLFFALN